MTFNGKKQHLSVLKVLKKLKPKEREEIIPYLNAEGLEFLCECFHNVLFEDIGVKNKSTLKKKLKSQCDVHRLKYIANAKKPLKAKVKALQQEGAGIGLILSAAIPFLMNLFGK
jgi:hypothetical protein